MKTLADLKKRLTIGTKIKLTYSNFKGHKYLNKIREVSHIQTNAIVFGSCWLYWPKAKDLRFSGENEFTVLDHETKTPALSYIIID